MSLQLPGLNYDQQNQLAALLNDICRAVAFPSTGDITSSLGDMSSDLSDLASSKNGFYLYLLQVDFRKLSEAVERSNSDIKKLSDVTSRGKTVANNFIVLANQCKKERAQEKGKKDFVALMNRVVTFNAFAQMIESAAMWANELYTNSKKIEALISSLQEILQIKPLSAGKNAIKASLAKVHDWQLDTNSLISLFRDRSQIIDSIRMQYYKGTDAYYPGGSILACQQEEWNRLNGLTRPMTLSLAVHIRCISVSSGLMKGLADLIRKIATKILSAVSGELAGDVGGPVVGKAVSTAVTVISDALKKPIDKEINKAINSVVSGLTKDGLNPDNFYLTSDIGSIGETELVNLNPGESYPYIVKGDSIKTGDALPLYYTFRGWDKDHDSADDLLFDYRVSPNKLSHAFSKVKDLKIGSQIHTYVVTGIKGTGAMYALKLTWTAEKIAAMTPPLFGPSQPIIVHPKRHPGGSS